MSFREWAADHDTSEGGNHRWETAYTGKVYQRIVTCTTPLAFMFGLDVEVDLGYPHTRELGTYENPRGPSPHILWITLSFGPWHISYIRERAAK